MPTLDDLARSLSHRSHSVDDIVRLVFSQDGQVALFGENELARARASLIGFAEFVNARFRANWHHALIAEKLEQLAAGQIKRLMVLTPPRHGKTLLCSHLFPSWVLGTRDEAIVGAAYNKRKASDEANGVKAILSSPRYRAVFPTAQIPKRSNESRNEIRRADHFNLVGRPQAEYRAAGIGSGLTGYNKTIGIIDDPIKSNADAFSERKREVNWEWYAGVYRIRDTHLLAGDTGVRDLLVQTPWHEDDLSGRILKTEAESWEVLRLPAILEPGAEKHPQDIRDPDMALWPSMWPVDKLLEVKRHFPREWASLFQCRPSSLDGNLFRRSDFQSHTDFDVPADGHWMVSVDASFGAKGQTSSYVAVQVWCFGHDCRAYLVDCWRGHWSFGQTLAQIQVATQIYPQCNEILVEEKANGPAIIETLRAHIGYAVVGVMPKGSKVARANAVAPWVAAKAVSLPNYSTWKEEFLQEVTSFPKSKTSDMVDAMSQALVKLQANPNADMQFWQQVLGLH